MGQGPGLNVMTFLMMSHKLDSGPLADQAAKLASYGADVVYVVDSAGAMVPSRPATGSPPAPGDRRPDRLPRPQQPGRRDRQRARRGRARRHLDRRIAAGAGGQRGQRPDRGAGRRIRAGGLADRGRTFGRWSTRPRSRGPADEGPADHRRDRILLGYAGVYSTFFTRPSGLPRVWRCRAATS